MRENLVTTTEWKQEDDGIFERRKETWIDYCPNCEGVCEWQNETEEWIEMPDGRWQHSGWGMEVGFCDPCDMLVVNGFDGLEAFSLTEPGEKTLQELQDEYQERS